MLKIAIKSVVVFLIVYAIICGLLYYFQRSLIYFPQAKALATDSIELASQGEKIQVTVKRNTGTQALVYFGGNAEDVSGSLATLSAAFPDSALYLMHYRGYGASSGRPSEAALIADGTALFDFVATSHSKITVMGRSLGSGVAIHIASIKPAASLVLVTPYNSVQELAQAQFPVLPVGLILQDKFESWRYARQINVPTLIIAAQTDEVIPRASTAALRNTFKVGIMKMEVLANTGHNSIVVDSGYIRLLNNFVNP